MNEDPFAPFTVNRGSFSYRDMIGQDRWQFRDETSVPFTTQFSVTVVGTPTYDLRWNVRGRLCEFAATFISTTSIATTAGTHYMNLPVVRMDNTGAIVPIGLAGKADMMNQSTLIWIGGCVVDPATGRLYLPTLAASASLLSVAGSYEV
jgi:hypothetical protein